MDTITDKMNLLREMIAFATVDGQLHDREYDFIQSVAHELEIDNSTLYSLFNEEKKVEIIKDEFHRILQFYRLALLMFADHHLHEKEVQKIHELGINMGLNPYAMKRILKLMNESPNQMVDPEMLLTIFTEQHN